MNSTIVFILAMTCAVPAAIGVARYRHIASNFHPFIYIMLLSVFSELVARLCLNYYNVNPSFYFINYNVYYLLNILLWLYFFFKNNVYENKIKVFYTLGIFCAAAAIMNLAWKGTINTIVWYAAILYAAIALVFSINLLTIQAFNTGNIPGKKFFIISSVTLIVYESAFILTASLIVAGTNNNWLKEKISYIPKVVIPLSYLFFAYAILCLPTKRKYD